MDPQAALIAIDWGTTSARAYLLAVDGTRIEQREASLGISQVADGAFPAALAKLLGPWIDFPLPRIASGMIGSRQGWVEAWYHECPASLIALAGALTSTPGGELRIVPGLIAADSGGIPDVMRGEETQLFGAIDDMESVVAVLPGTHSKWARMERGTVVSFATYFTGELYAVLTKHSILGRMAEQASPSPAAAFDRGVNRGLASEAITHDLFGARTLALTGSLQAREIGDWLSGLLIGAEIGAARPWLQEQRHPVRIVGGAALTERYERALHLAGIVSERGSADAAARGLWRIAKQAGLI